MRVTQLNYSAIKNAYAAQLGAKSAEVAVGDQQSAQRYLDSTRVTQMLSLGMELGSAAMQMGKGIYKLKSDADAAEASTALTTAIPELTAYIEEWNNRGGAIDVDADGNITPKPGFMEGFRSILEGRLNEDWTPEVQKQFMQGGTKLASSTLADAISTSAAGFRESRTKNELLEVGFGVDADIAAGGGYENTDRAINAMTGIDSYTRENLRIEKHRAVDVGTWNQSIAGYIERGDYAGGREYIKSLVESGKINAGSDEYNALQNNLASGFSAEKARVATEAQNYAAEALAGGTSPNAMRSALEAEMEARGYSEEFKEAGRDGAGIAQASYAYSAIEEDLTSLLNGHSTINDLQTFRKEIKDGKYSYLFEGIESEADKLIGDIIDPAIKDLRDFMDEIDQSMEDDFKKNADAVMAGNYKPSDKIYLISSFAGQNPSLQILARGYIDTINDSLLTDSQKLIFDNWDKLAETRIKDAAGDLWGKEGGMPYMQKLVDFRVNMEKFVQSHTDNLTDDMLNDFAVQQLGLLLSSDIDSINEAARLGSGEGTLVEAGARDILHPIEGDFGYDTKKLGQAVDAVLSPEMRNERILDPDTGAWESTTDEGENLWNQMLVLEYTLLNEEGILATKTYPMADAEGNVYTYPVSEDKDGNKYIIDKEGLFRQVPGSTEWELIRPFNPAKTSDRQEEQPEILLRHTKSDGNQFWHEGTWYTVSKLDPDSEIGQAYGMYRRTYKGRIPNAEER